MSRTITFAPLCSSPSAPSRAIYYCTYCGKSGMKLHKAIDFCTPITDDCFLNTWVQLEALRYIHQSQKPEPLKISPIISGVIKDLRGGWCFELSDFTNFLNISNVTSSTAMTEFFELSVKKLSSNVLLKFFT